MAVKKPGETSKKAPQLTLKERRAQKREEKRLTADPPKRKR